MDTVKGQSDSKFCVDNGNAGEQIWCYCDQVESGHMFGRDNAECLTELFNYTYLVISSAPKGTWYVQTVIKYHRLRKVLKRWQIPIDMYTEY